MQLLAKDSVLFCQRISELSQILVLISVDFSLQRKFLRPLLKQVDSILSKIQSLLGFIEHLLFLGEKLSKIDQVVL